VRAARADGGIERGEGADLDGIRRVLDVDEAQPPPGWGDGLIGDQRKLAIVGQCNRVRVAFGCARLIELADVARGSWFSHVEDEHAEIPVREVRRASVGAQRDAVQEGLRRRAAAVWRAL